MPYHHFAAIYPLFSLISNPRASLEIGIVDFMEFKERYLPFILFYNRHFKEQVLYEECTPNNKHHPHTLRFLRKPTSEAKYIYIGDVDIIILEENICEIHKKYIKKHKLEYSNILRDNSNFPRLSGLHFIEYSKMYPLPKNTIGEADYCNDEHYLYLLMQSKGYTAPEKEFKLRPVHGIHCSMNRPPIKSTPFSNHSFRYFHWGISYKYAKLFRKHSKNPVYREFLKIIDPKKHLQLAILIQNLELALYFELKRRNKLSRLIKP